MNVAVHEAETTAAQALLFREARLLDQRRFDEWLEMFAPDARYWVPAGRPDAEPDEAVSLIFDSYERLCDRVFRQSLPSMHSQNPPSQTVHVVTNVEVEDLTSDTMTVHSCFVLGQLRAGDWRQYGLGKTSEQVLFGRCEHRFVRDAGAWKIRLKKVDLVQSAIALDVLSFII
jgi:3-phenylpropionate/cinnamic acid dioxygenase small subunit